MIRADLTVTPPAAAAHPSAAAPPPSPTLASVDLSPGEAASPPEVVVAAPSSTAVTAVPPPVVVAPRPPLTLTIDEVKAELKRLHPCNATASDRVCPRLLRECAVQLAEPHQGIFNSCLSRARQRTTDWWH